MLLLNIYQIAVMPLNMGLIFLLSVIFVDPKPAPINHPAPAEYEKKQKQYMYLMFYWLCLLTGFSSFTGVILVGYSKYIEKWIY